MLAGIARALIQGVRPADDPACLRETALRAALDRSGELEPHEFAVFTNPSVLG
jgi:hypothetical protein